MRQWTGISRRSMIASTAKVALVAAGLAMGFQTASAQDAVTSDSENIIVVTATKRETTLQEVAGSASVLSAEQTELTGISDVEALANAIPNLSFGEHDGASFVTIRGVGASVEIGIGEPSVATYVDGVFLPRQTMGFLSQSGLERIEVLRGPQGTLYGRNSTGGAINFISKSPSDSLEGKIEAGTGSFNAFNVGGLVSGPLSDGLRASLSAEFETNDGYVDNLLTGTKLAGFDRFNIRGAIQADLSDRTTIDAFVQYQDTSGATAWQQLVSPALSPLLPPGFQSTLEPRKIFAQADFSSSQETLIASFILEHEFSDAVSIKSQTSYIDHKSEASFDGDATDFGLVDVAGFVRPSESWQQEITLSGETGALSWLVGGFFFTEDFFAAIPAPFPNGLPAPAAPPFGLPPGTFSFQTLTEKTDSYAIFADIEFAITDRLKLLAGARMNWEDKEFLQTLGANIPGLGFMGASDIPSQRSDNEFLPKIGLSFDVNDDFKLYGHYQQGLKSAGQNLGVLLTQYEPEILDAYEAGFRSTWLGGDLVLNGAGFFYDYANYQVTDLPGGTATVVQNADAEIRGFEVEFVATPTTDTRISGGLTHLDSDYTNFTSLDLANPFAGPQNLAGQQLVRAPSFTFNLSVQHEFPVADGLILGADFFHSDDVVLRYFGTPQDTQSSFSNLDIRATLKLLDGALRLHAFGRNITDEDVLRVVIFSPLSGSHLGNYAPGANWGAGASFKF